MPRPYDNNGMPIPDGMTDYNDKGFPAGSISYEASQRHKRLSTPIEGPGAARRYFEGLGIPTDQKGWQQLGIHTALNAATAGMYTPMSQAYDAAQLAGQGEFGQAANVANPIAPMMTNIGDENWAGLAGNLTPYAVGAAASGLAGARGGAARTKPVPANTVPVTVEGVPPAPSVPKAMAKLIARRVPGLNWIMDGYNFLQDVGAVKQPTRNQTFHQPVTPTPKVPPPPPLEYSGTDFPMQPTNAPVIPQRSGSAPVNSASIVDELLNPIRVDVPPTIPDAPVMQFNATNTGIQGPPAPATQGSPPLRTGADWFQQPVEAAYGNAPRQPGGQLPLTPPSTAAKMSSDPARLEQRFEPGRSPMETMGTADRPQLTPGQDGMPTPVEGGAGPVGPPAGPQVGFDPITFNNLLNSLSSLKKGVDNFLTPDPPTLGPSTAAKDLRTGQQAKQVAKEKGWNRDVKKADKPPSGGGGSKGPKS